MADFRSVFNPVLADNGNSKAYEMPSVAPPTMAIHVNSIPPETSYPLGIKFGDMVKLKISFKEYRDKDWNSHNIDLSQDIYFKQHYDKIIFKVIGCRGNEYLEISSNVNDTTYDIYVMHSIVELYNKSDEELNNSSVMFQPHTSYSPNTNNSYFPNYEDTNVRSINDSLYDIPIEDYIYCAVDEVNDWCRDVDAVNNPYDYNEYSWTNKDFQYFYDDISYIESFSLRKLVSVMYDDIFLSNETKEKAFRLLFNHAVSGNIEALYWIGVVAFQGLAGRTTDKNIAYSFILLAEKNGFRATDGFRTWYKSPSSEYITNKYSLSVSGILFSDITELYVENEYCGDYNGNYYDDDDYEDDDDDYDYDYENYNENYSSAFSNGDSVMIKSNVNRYWTDIYNKNSRINGIPANYYDIIWTIVENDGNKFLLQYTTTKGFLFSKRTEVTSVVLCRDDIYQI